MSLKLWKLLIFKSQKEILQFRRGSIDNAYPNVCVGSRIGLLWHIYFTDAECSREAAEMFLKAGGV